MDLRHQVSLLPAKEVVEKVMVEEKEFGLKNNNTTLSLLDWGLGSHHIHMIPVIVIPL